MRPFALAAFLVSAPVLSATAERAFGPGEQAFYSVTWHGLTAGEAVIAVGPPTPQRGPDVWPIVCTAKTTNLGSTLAIKDKFVTWWDDKNNRTLGNDLFADEFHKRRHESIVFHPDGRAQVTRRLEGQPIRESEWEVQPGSLDVAAAAMALRNTPLEMGKQVQFPVFTGTRNVVMKATVLGKEKLNTALGPKDTWKLSVQTEFSGKLANKNPLILHLSADQNQVPVKVDAEFALGTVSINLVRYEQGAPLEAAR
jgi:hypothetical protein